VGQRNRVLVLDLCCPRVLLEAQSQPAGGGCGRGTAKAITSETLEKPRKNTPGSISCANRGIDDGSLVTPFYRLLKGFKLSWKIERQVDSLTKRLDPGPVPHFDVPITVYYCLAPAILLEETNDC
jgi:hypothetical protein